MGLRGGRGAALAAGLWIGGCALAAAALGCASVRPIPPGRSVVLPAEQLEKVLWLCSRPGPRIEDVMGTWEVTEEVVALLEADLPKLRRLRASCCIRGLRIRQPWSFFRQYLGIVIDGRRVVYVNFFRDEESFPQWRERAVQVCDGGDYYWGAIYDPDTRRFSQLVVNGEA